MKSRSFPRMAIAVALTVSSAFVGCGDDSVPATPDAGDLDAGPADGGGTDAGSLVRLRGGVQKGPFILGSSLAISPIDGVGNPTGAVFNTMTFNDLGEFAVEFSYLGAVSLEAQGYYYNEATGELSGAPLTLRAYHEVSSGGAQAAYLNIITHLTYARVRQLVVEGSALLDATAQAEGELRAELGIGPTDFTPEAAGIYLNVLGGDSDSNAYLLAVSSVLAQAGVVRGGDAALQELLNMVSTDLGTDGRLADALKMEIDTAHRAVDGDTVMAAFRARLTTLGSDLGVPDIHRMLDTDGDSNVNADDNCRTIANAAQTDSDADGMGDACDLDVVDLDADGVWNADDNCPNDANAGQEDMDGDGPGDPCDNCVGYANPLQENGDGDVWGNACDNDMLWPTAAWFVEDAFEGAPSLAWGDVDGDGDLDLAVGNVAGTFSTRLFRYEGGALSPTAVWSAASTGVRATSVAWGDVDRDGDPDLAVGYSGQPNRLYRNDGGTLTVAAVWASTEADLTNSIAWGDVDGDGDLDLAVGNNSQPNRLYRNDTGTLTAAAVWSAPVTEQTFSVAWGDVDGDGDLDLAVGNVMGPSRVYRNDVGILNGVLWTTATETNSVAWGDVDGDGDVDLAVGGASASVYRNDGGTLTATAAWSSSPCPPWVQSVAWGDMDADGDLDLAVGCGMGSSRVYRNDGAGLSTAAVWGPTGASGVGVVVAWGDMDGDGDLDLAAGNGVGPRVYINTLR